jgi:hypothetical protein
MSNEDLYEGIFRATARGFKLARPRKQRKPNYLVEEGLYIVPSSPKRRKRRPPPASAAPIDISAAVSSAATAAAAAVVVAEVQEQQAEGASVHYITLIRTAPSTPTDMNVEEPEHTHSTTAAAGAAAVLVQPRGSRTPNRVHILTDEIDEQRRLRGVRDPNARRAARIKLQMEEADKWDTCLESMSAALLCVRSPPEPNQQCVDCKIPVGEHGILCEECNSVSLGWWLCHDCSTARHKDPTWHRLTQWDGKMMRHVKQAATLQVPKVPLACACEVATVEYKVTIISSRTFHSVLYPVTLGQVAIALAP